MGNLLVATPECACEHTHSSLWLPVALQLWVQPVSLSSFCAGLICRDHSCCGLVSAMAMFCLEGSTLCTALFTILQTLHSFHHFFLIISWALDRGVGMKMHCLLFFHILISYDSLLTVGCHYHSHAAIGLVEWHCIMQATTRWVC